MIDTFADQSSFYDSRCVRLLGKSRDRSAIIEAGFHVSLSCVTAIKKASCASGWRLAIIR